MLVTFVPILSMSSFPIFLIWDHAATWLLGFFLPVVCILRQRLSTAVRSFSTGHPLAALKFCNRADARA